MYSQNSLYPSLSNLDFGNSRQSPPVHLPPPPANPSPRHSRASNPSTNDGDLIQFYQTEFDEFDPLYNKSVPQRTDTNAPDNENDSFMNIFDLIYEKPSSSNSNSALYANISLSDYKDSFSQRFSPPSSPQLYPCLSNFKNVPESPESSQTSAIQLPPAELFTIVPDKPVEPDLLCFIEAVRNLCEKNSSATSTGNPGLLLNRPVKAVTLNDNNSSFTYLLPNVTVEIMKYSQIDNLFSIECDVNNLLTDDLLLMALNHFQDENYLDGSQFHLRIRGRIEYLQKNCKLAEHSHVINCCRYAQNLKLVLEPISMSSNQLKRTAFDDANLFTLEEAHVCNQQAFLPLEELKRLLYNVRSDGQEVKEYALSREWNMMKHLSYLERYIESVVHLCDQLDKVYPPGLQRYLGFVDNIIRKNHHTDNFASTVEDNLQVLDRETNQLLLGYARLHNTPYAPLNGASPILDGQKKAVFSDSMTEYFSVHLESFHRFPEHWKTTYQSVQMEWRLYFGNQPLCEGPWQNAQPCAWQKSSFLTHRTMHNKFPSLINLDQEAHFDYRFHINHLPRETLLHFRLLGKKLDPVSGSSVDFILAWAHVPLFNLDNRLKQGCHWIAFWSGKQSSLETSKAIPCTQLSRSPKSPILVVNFKEYPHPVIYPPIFEEELEMNMGNFSDLPIHIQESLHRDVRFAWFLDDPSMIAKLVPINKRNPLQPPSIMSISNNLWDNRGFLMENPVALISLLLAVMRCCPKQVVQAQWSRSKLIGHLLSLMKVWAWPDPVLALRLLCPDMPDRNIRQQACQWLGRSEPEHIQIYMPQILQCLKGDLHLNECELASFLIDMSLQSLHFANALYWQLKECKASSCHGQFLQIIFSALLNASGRGMRSVWRDQEEVVLKLSHTATLVKDAGNSKQSKDDALFKGLGDTYDYIIQKQYREHNMALRMPYDLGLGSCKLDVKSCNYFSSFTVPLRVVFSNYDESSPAVSVMFKNGDDLRQDQLITNLFVLMDQIWLENGIDLKMIHFRVLPTSTEKGMVELVTECATLRKVQEYKGGILGGPFDKHSIASWLRAQCSDGPSYFEAVKNFLYSSAACCVATYLLGIGDRHNDNIMLKSTGHMFHIDFARILGDFQKIAGINRDRVPFVFTPPMAHVLTDFPSPIQGQSGLEIFIDTCCKAYNVLRKNFYKLYVVLQLSATANIKGVDCKSIQYFVDALRLNCSELEATAAFTEDLRKTLDAKSTQWNHLIHNIAQAKFTSDSDGTLFSFTPQVHSIKVDGKISRIEIGEVQTRSDGRVYRVIVYRDHLNRPGHVFRSMAQFVEFMRLLQDYFKLAAQLMEVTNPILRSYRNTYESDRRVIAEERRDGLQRFANVLLSMAPEISECDLVYTFFHTLPSDHVDRENEERKLTSYLDPELPKRIEVNLDLELSSDEREITVLVKTARNIRLMNREAPNPYVKLRLLPDPRGMSKKKTRIVMTTSNPSFNETITYKLDDDDYYQNFTIQVALWHKRLLMGRNMSLGKTYIEMSILQPGVTTSQTLYLNASENNRGSDSALQYSGSTLPLARSSTSSSIMPGSGWS